jgi:hypothetical protein
MSAKDGIREAIAKARQTPGKEPFDIQKFQEVYDVTIDIGDAPLTMRRVEEYEEQYYLLATTTKTLREFAEYRQRLSDQDSN